MTKKYANMFLSPEFKRKFREKAASKDMSMSEYSRYLVNNNIDIEEELRSEESKRWRYKWGK